MKFAWPQKRPISGLTPVHPLLIAFIASAAIVLLYNTSLWGAVFQAWTGRTATDITFMGSIGAVLTCALFLLFQLFAFPYVIKPLLAVILMLAAAASWFMSNYGVMFDQTMIANVIETDSGEAGDLLSVGLLTHILLFGFLPAAAVLALPATWLGWRRELIWRASSALVCFIVIGLTASFFFQDYASLVRNNRYLRHMVNPTALIYYSAKYLGGRTAGPGTYMQVAKQVSRKMEAEAHKPLLYVAVVGETARAADFSLNGYERNTNPELASLPAISFANAASCGTSTAESLPCMFSADGRGSYDKERAQHSENALDILKRAGFDVIWIENNSGCKGVCARIPTVRPDPSLYPDMCNENGCMDEVLAEELKSRTQNLSKDTVIVLHQIGSHGPAYFKRYTKDYEAFKPACQTTQLQACDTTEIRNAYDNSILYTDHILASIVSVLQDRTNVADTALLYASDHGESLGELGLYLHGMPYAFSPDVQRHIPFILWLSRNYEERYAISEDCLTRLSRSPVSHDAIFHSILGGTGVETEIYKPGLDLYAACRVPPATAFKHSGQRS